ncbi:MULTISPECIES: histidine kinase [unclassified Sphingobacterium]|uniref:histidine kinase n=1 Tax=unclassified Sphingobacterium TaxID=2609468 RepID=UPI0025D8B3BE|nr:MULTISPECIES: histidine kinase [unclassified Sphingobacterium]
MTSIFNKLWNRTAADGNEQSTFENQLSFLECQVDRKLLDLWASACLENRNESWQIRFAKLQQTSLSRIHSEPVSVSKEIEYLNDYCLVYQEIRPSELYVSFKSDYVETSAIIYPFLLMPLVQNAIHNGYTSMEKYPVKIKVTGSQKLLIMEVSNRVNHRIADQQSTDIIRLFRERLQFLYPDRHDLLFNSNSNTFKATLTVQL